MQTDIIASFQWLDGTYKKEEVVTEVVKEACSDRMEEDLNIKRVDLDCRKDPLRRFFFYYESAQTQVAQRSCRWPILRSVQCQVWQNFKQKKLTKEKMSVPMIGQMD